jgi:hypothetical protein
MDFLARLPSRAFFFAELSAFDADIPLIPLMEYCKIRQLS